MALPLLKIEGGEPVALTWTRLKPASEVTTATPPPPAPIRRPGVSLGPERLEIVGEGFDRRTVVATDVVADDGLHVIGGKQIKVRGLTGQTFRYEPNRAWSPSDMATVEPYAWDVLKAHDFPVQLEWPAGVWAWEGDDLLWADAPAHAVLIRDGEEDLGMSGVERGGLGWSVRPHADDVERSERLWPRFSPFGWAIEIVDMLRYQRGAVVTFQRLIVQAMHDVSGGRGCEPGLPAFDEDHLRGFVAEDLARVWNLGFALGDYLAEYRVRRDHGDMLTAGQKTTQVRRSAGTKTGAMKKAAADALWRSEAITRAISLRASHPTWGKPRIAKAIVEAIPKAPELTTVEAVLLAWEKDGTLPARASKG